MLRRGRVYSAVDTSPWFILRFDAVANGQDRDGKCSADLLALTPNGRVITGTPAFQLEMRSEYARKAAQGVASHILRLNQKKSTFILVVPDRCPSPLNVSSGCWYFVE